jgi:predicted phage terminase large subunit-like protein
MPLLWSWHIDEICEHLDAISRNYIKHLIINVPPGTSKSMLVSVLWPAWQWIIDPTWKSIYASFDDSLSLKSARRVRNLIESKWWKERWPEVSINKHAGTGVDEYETLDGGFRFSTSIGGRGTGRHAHLFCVDDPHKPLDLAGRGSDTQANANTVWAWWTGTVPTRQADPQKWHKVVVMQRLAELDLTGRLLDEMQNSGEHYEHLCLPMRFDPGRKCRTLVGGDRRTEKEELLFPARFSETVVDALEKSLKANGGDQNVSAQLQQDPSASSGNFFKQSCVQHWGVLGSPIERFPVWTELTYWQSWDFTFKGKEAAIGQAPDFVVGQVWAEWRGEYLLVDQVRGQWGIIDSLKAVRVLHKLYPKAYRVLIEDKANGPAVANLLEGEILGIELVNPKKGKIDRATAILPLWEDYHVWLPPPDVLDPITNKPWVPDLIKELKSFPAGKNDDQVDTISQALEEPATRNRVGNYVNFVNELSKQTRLMAR